MKRLLTVAVALLVAVAMTGCASVAPGVTVTSIYTPGALGGQVGEIKRVEDTTTGVVFYYIIEAGPDQLVGAFLKDGTPLMTDVRMYKNAK